MAAVAQTYAGAFADVLEDAGADLSAAFEQLSSFGRIYAESHDLREVMSNPAVPFEQKLKVLDAICKKLGAGKEVRNFLAVLLQNGRMEELPEILAGARVEIDKRSGIVEAEIVSARELTAGQRSHLEKKVAGIAGHEHVRARYKLDPCLLGGATIKLGSTVFDGSIAGQLKRLKEQLSAT